MALPAALSQGLAALLEGRSRAGLAGRAQRLSAHYRAGGGSKRVVAAAEDTLAYALSRLPATYAAVSAVLEEVRERAPSFAPAGLLDAGAGPGTASWAAVAAWPELATVAMLDHNAAFAAMARDLAGLSPHGALRAATEHALDLAAPGVALPPADLVIAAYALTELDAGVVEAVVARLWAACAGILVLVEPGTPAGHARLLACRQQLLAAGARLVAPCPHVAPCPVRAPDWCHFSRRLDRSRDHRLVKGASLPFEDEKFAYIAAAQPAIALDTAAARILAPPELGKARLCLKLCVDGRVEHREVARRDSHAFALWRRARWGDAAPAGRDGV